MIFAILSISQLLFRNASRFSLIFFVIIFTSYTHLQIIQKLLHKSFINFSYSSRYYYSVILRKSFHFIIKHATTQIFI